MSRRYLQSLTNDTVHPLSLKHKTGYKIYDYVEKLIDYQQTQQAGFTFPRETFYESENS